MMVFLNGQTIPEPDTRGQQTLDDHFLNGGKQTWHPGFALFPPIR